MADLDHGEEAAIALALEIPADLLLIDERKGRAIALSLRVLAGCRFADTLVGEVLCEVGE